MRRFAKRRSAVRLSPSPRKPGRLNQFLDRRSWLPLAPEASVWELAGLFRDSFRRRAVGAGSNSFWLIYTPQTSGFAQEHIRKIAAMSVNPRIMQFGLEVEF